MFSIPPLPYGYDALEKLGMSKEQLAFHYDKHHQGYVTKLNAAAQANADLSKKTVEELIVTEKGPLYNLSAQIWNHTFYWSCMSPNGGGAPSDKLKAELEKSFGSVDKFKEQFSAAAVGHFGSGWAWLIQDGDKLTIHQTHDAGCPLSEGLKPVLTCDVWEHAYYIDFRNDRPAYVKNFWNVINWEFVEANVFGKSNL